MKKLIILFFTISVLFGCKNDPPQIVKIEGKLVPVAIDVQSDAKIEEVIKPYKVKVDAEMSNIISYSPKFIGRTDGELESSLGNLFADLSYERANPVFKARTGKNIDFALFNYGGLRSSIVKGKITIKDIYTLMPFENYLVVVELSPVKMKELLTYLVKYEAAHPLSKHANLLITKNGYQFKINNVPFNETKNYYVLTTDYLQNGGDLMSFFREPVKLFRLDYRARNAIIDYLKETDTIKTILDGRFRKEK